MNATVTIGRHGLDRSSVVAVARHGARVTLGDDARAAIERGAAVVDRLVDQPEPVYGVSTGFGALANTVIPPERSRRAADGPVRSHAAGMGPEVEREVVRAMVLLRARSLAMGFSGARPVVVETMLALLDAGLTPVVREHGSLGASGDLAPLAPARWCCSARARPAGRRLAGRRRDGLRGRLAPLAAAKEGLALINGTDGMLGMLVLALADLDVLLRAADVAGGDVDRGPARHGPRLRRRPRRDAPAGRAGASARRTCAGCSPARRSWPATATATTGCRTPTRCAARRRSTARRATRSSTPRRSPTSSCVSSIDNPVVLPDGRVESCGNFHGAPLAAVCDFLAISIADVGAISERRTDRLLDPTRSHGLPPFLVARRRRQLGPDDRPVHAGGDGRREPPPRRPGEHRHAADQRDAGGPRLDGLGRGPQAAQRRRQPRPHPRRRAARARPAGLDLRAPLRAGGRDGSRAACPARRRLPGPGPDRGWRRSSLSPNGWSCRATSSRPSRRSPDHWPDAARPMGAGMTERTCWHPSVADAQ